MRELYSPIVWIAHEYQLSGANYSLLEFMKVLQKEGVSQILIVNRKGPMQEAAENIGIKVRYLKFYGWVREVNKKYTSVISLKKEIRNIYAVFQLSKIIIECKAKLVVTSTTTFNVGAWAATLTFRKHYWRISEFGEEDFGFKMPWGSFSYRFMEFTTDKILLNSRALFKKYDQLIINKSKLKIVYNPVFVEAEKIRKERFSDSKNIKVLILGQINKNKGHLEAIKAIQKLKSNKPGKQFTLSVVGNTPDQSYLQDLLKYVEENDLSKLVKFYSFTHDVEQLMFDHDLLLMCSRSEAFGRVTAEAMKRFLPVIGTSSGGTPDMIIPSITGLLYEPGDYNELAKNIYQLAVRETINYTELTENAYQRINELTNTEVLVKTFLKKKNKRN